MGAQASLAQTRLEVRKAFDLLSQYIARSTRNQGAMRSFALITLLALIAQAHAEESVADDSADDSMDNFVDMLLDKLTDKLVDSSLTDYGDQVVDENDEDEEVDED